MFGGIKALNASRATDLIQTVKVGLKHSVISDIKRQYYAHSGPFSFWDSSRTALHD